jgi:triosephosphate isomerase (TIM)
MIILNFKIYPETFDQAALALAQIAQKVSQESGVKIVLAVSALDLYRLSQKVSLDLYLQHTDLHQQGPFTGQISSLQASYLGAKGTLLNHSEHPLPPGTIRTIIKQNQTIKNLKTVLCVKSFGQAEKWGLKTKPDYLAYEPKNLIGRKDVSVSSQKPEIIKKLVDLSSPLPVLAGAGIHQKQDITIALSLGAKGVIVSSDVVTATNPEKELADLASAFA